MCGLLGRYSSEYLTWGQNQKQECQKAASMAVRRDGQRNQEKSGKRHEKMKEILHRDFDRILCSGGHGGSGKKEARITQPRWGIFK